MKTDELDIKHIMAEDGKILRRISDGQIFRCEIFLGYTYYIGGQPLNEPLLELPEHYEEIDEPIEDSVIIDEVTDLVESEILTNDLLPEEPSSNQPAKVTLSDYRALEDKVKIMMNLLGINN